MSDRVIGVALMIISLIAAVLYVWGLLTPRWDLILLIAHRSLRGSGDLRADRVDRVLASHGPLSLRGLGRRNRQ